MTAIEKRIRRTFNQMGLDDISRRSKWFPNRFEALGQYGYALSLHDTKTEADEAVIKFYSENMECL